MGVGEGMGVNSGDESWLVGWCGVGLEFVVLPRIVCSKTAAHNWVSHIRLAIRFIVELTWWWYGTYTIDRHNRLSDCCKVQPPD